MRNFGTLNVSGIRIMGISVYTVSKQYFYGCQFEISIHIFSFLFIVALDPGLNLSIIHFGVCFIIQQKFEISKL